MLGIIVTTLSPLLAATSVTLALEYRRTFDEVALLTGWHLIGVAVGGFIFVPSSRVWGKRHTFLIGTCICILSSAWGGASGLNYKSMLWARVFQGIGLAPFEALVNATVGDLYFVHERGKRMAISNFAVFGGAFMTPVVVGKIAREMGWEWSFYFVAIFAGVLLPFLVFFVPETAYRRDASLNTDTAITLQGHRRSIQFQDVDTQHLRHNAREGGAEEDYEKRLGTASSSAHQVDSPSPKAPPPAKVTYLQSIAPFNGRKTDESLWKLVLRPLPLFFHPSVTWACLIQGAIIGWTVFIGIVLAAIMLGPPLFFNEVKTGYMYTSAFIGAFVGFILSGLLSDSTANWMTRKNRGVFEPEFRLPLVLPMMILSCIGLYGFGITSDDTYKYGWFWPDFFFAFEVAGMVLGAVASSLYIVDAHRTSDHFPQHDIQKSILTQETGEISIEAFTCMMIFKNVFSFGLTYSGYHWLVVGGIKQVFVAVASVQVGICFLTVPLYFYGKRNRSFFARYDMLKLLHLW
jgi:MFS family permease